MFLIQCSASVDSKPLQAVSRSRKRDEGSASVEGLPVARTQSGGSADDRPQGPSQRHDDVLAYENSKVPLFGRSNTKPETSRPFHIAFGGSLLPASADKHIRRQSPQRGIPARSAGPDNLRTIRGLLSFAKHLKSGS